MARYQRPEQTASFPKRLFLRSSNCAVEYAFCFEIFGNETGFVSSTLGLCRLPSSMSRHERPASGAAASEQASEQASNSKLIPSLSAFTAFFHHLLRKI